MKKLPLILASLLITATSEARVLRERNLDFNVDVQKIGNGDVQVAVHYTTPEKLKGLRINSIDTQDSGSVPDSRLVAMKSAFVINRDISEINRPGFFSPQQITDFYPGLQYSNPGVNCAIHLQMPDKPLIPEYISCNFNLKHFDSSAKHRGVRAVEGFPALDPEFGTPDAITMQDCDQFSRFFKTLTFMNRFYKLGPRKTLVVNYQIITVNNGTAEKIDSIPFVSFKNEMRDNLEEQALRMAEGMNRKN